MRQPEKVEGVRLATDGKVSPATADGAEADDDEAARARSRNAAPAPPAHLGPGAMAQCRHTRTLRTMAFLPTGTRLAAFRTQVARQWHRASLRRSQRRRLPWARMRRLVSRWLPRTPISHPWPASGPARQSLSEAGSTDRLGSTDAPIPRSRTRDRERHCRWTA